MTKSIKIFLGVIVSVMVAALVATGLLLFLKTEEEPDISDTIVYTQKQKDDFAGALAGVVGFDLEVVNSPSLGSMEKVSADMTYQTIYAIGEAFVEAKIPSDVFRKVVIYLEDLKLFLENYNIDFSESYLLSLLEIDNSIRPDLAEYKLVKGLNELVMSLIDSAAPVGLTESESDAGVIRQKIQDFLDCGLTYQDLGRIAYHTIDNFLDIVEANSAKINRILNEQLRSPAELSGGVATAITDWVSYYGPVFAGSTAVDSASSTREILHGIGEEIFAVSFAQMLQDLDELLLLVSEMSWANIRTMLYELADVEIDEFGNFNEQELAGRVSNFTKVMLGYIESLKGLRKVGANSYGQTIEGVFVFPEGTKELLSSLEIKIYPILNLVMTNMNSEILNMANIVFDILGIPSDAPHKAFKYGFKILLSSATIDLLEVVGNRVVDGLINSLELLANEGYVEELIKQLAIELNNSRKREISFVTTTVLADGTEIAIEDKDKINQAYDEINKVFGAYIWRVKDDIPFAKFGTGFRKINKDGDYVGDKIYTEREVWEYIVREYMVGYLSDDFDVDTGSEDDDSGDSLDSPLLSAVVEESLNLFFVAKYTKAEIIDIINDELRVIVGKGSDRLRYDSTVDEVIAMMNDVLLVRVRKGWIIERLYPMSMDSGALGFARNWVLYGKAIEVAESIVVPSSLIAAGSDYMTYLSVEPLGRDYLTIDTDNNGDKTVNAYAHLYFKETGGTIYYDSACTIQVEEQLYTAIDYKWGEGTEGSELWLDLEGDDSYSYHTDSSGYKDTRSGFYFKRVPLTFNVIDDKVYYGESYEVRYIVGEKTWNYAKEITLVDLTRVVIDFVGLDPKYNNLVKETDSLSNAMLLMKLASGLISRAGDSVQISEGIWYTFKYTGVTEDILAEMISGIKSIAEDINLIEIIDASSWDAPIVTVQESDNYYVTLNPWETDYRGYLAEINSETGLLQKIEITEEEKDLLNSFSEVRVRSISSKVEDGIILIKKVYLYIMDEREDESGYVEEYEVCVDIHGNSHNEPVEYYLLQNGVAGFDVNQYIIDVSLMQGGISIDSMEVMMAQGLNMIKTLCSIPYELDGFRFYEEEFWNGSEFITALTVFVNDYLIREDSLKIVLPAAEGPNGTFTDEQIFNILIDIMQTMIEIGEVEDFVDEEASEEEQRMAMLERSMDFVSSLQAQYGFERPFPMLKSMVLGPDSMITGNLSRMLSGLYGALEMPTELVDELVSGRFSFLNMMLLSMVLSSSQ